MSICFAFYAVGDAKHWITVGGEVRFARRAGVPTTAAKRAATGGTTESTVIPTTKSTTSPLSTSSASWSSTRPFSARTTEATGTQIRSSQHLCYEHQRGSRRTPVGARQFFRWALRDKCDLKKSTSTFVWAVQIIQALQFPSNIQTTR